MVAHVKSLILLFRLPFIIAANVALTSLAYVLALGLRFDFDLKEAFTVERLSPLLFLLAFRLATYTWWELNQGYWKYVSTHDLITIIKAHVLSSLLFTAVVGFLRVPGFPRSVIFVELALSVLFSGGIRFITRIFCERVLSDWDEDGQVLSREIVVLGAGDSGHILVKNLLSNSRLSYRPVAVLDDSERLRGTRVQGIPVVGVLNDLAKILEEYPRVSAVIIAIPTLSAAKFNEIKETCESQSVLFKRVQSFEDLACLDASLPLTSLKIETLLEKEIDVEHEDEIREALHGKRVLITGAGGSIGSELVRQIVPFEPESIILFDHSEFNLFQINRELAEKFPESRTIAVLGTICDERRLDGIFREYKPQVVFHAAAYKHVPLVEANPYGAFWNNVVGTKNVIDACHKGGALRLILISSDKAVDPSSTMGCSKRIAELLVREYAANYPQGTSTSVVRFGNVINSAGSVVPLFKEQILSGGPVTVTHPDMERFFMSIREAVRLVLTAGTLGERGEVFVLDMGTPIKIVDVARKMLTLFGRKDIPIVFTGVRPGEKLSEELLAQGEIRHKTRFPKVHKLSDGIGKDACVTRWVRKIAESFDRITEERLGVLMREIIPTESNVKPAIEAERRITAQ